MFRYANECEAAVTDSTAGLFAEGPSPASDG